MKKKIFFILFMLLFYKTNIHALTYGGCDFSDVARMKQVVTNVSITYDYKIVNNKAYFDVTISNLTNDIYIKDNYANKEYYKFTNGELVIHNVSDGSISLKFNSNKKECKGLLLGTKYEQFPIYNKYYNNDVCKDMEGFSQCEKWVSKAYTLDEIKAAIKKYNDSLKENPEEPTKEIYKKTFFDKLIDFYVKYYLVFLISIIGVCMIIILVHRKRSQFKI